MTVTSPGSIYEAVEAGLDRGAGRVTPLGAGRWKASPAAGSTLSIVVRVDGDWLVLRALMEGGEPVDRAEAERLLRRNASLDWPAKFFLCGSAPLAGVMAEVLLTGDAETLEQRVAQACGSFARAVEAYRGRDSQAVFRWGGAGDACEQARLASLCGEAGWAGFDRSGGRVAAPLETPGDAGEALVEAGPDGSVRAWTHLGELPDAPTAVREALVDLLLRVGSVVRPVRAVAAEHDGAPGLGFEVLLPPPASGEALGDALAALSIARRLCAREARALNNELIAREYLRARARNPANEPPDRQGEQP